MGIRKSGHKLRDLFNSVAAAGLVAGISGCTVIPFKGGPVKLEPRINEALLAPLPLSSGSVVASSIDDNNISDSPIVGIYNIVSSDNHTVEKLSFPGSNGQEAAAYLSLPETQGPHPVIVVFPTLGGSYSISEILAKAYVNKDYAVLHMQSFPLEFDKIQDPDILLNTFRHAIIDARTILTYIEQRPDIDRSRIAASGVSLGGILAATLTGVDDRIQAGVFMLAGGHLPNILASSRENSIDKFRHYIMGTKNLDREEFADFLHELTPVVDPLRYAGSVDPSRVLLISGRFDRIVPPENTELLWEHFHRPAWIEVPSGHYDFALYFNWAVNRAAEHFDTILRLEKTPSPAALENLSPVPR